MSPAVVASAFRRKMQPAVVASAFGRKISPAVVGSAFRRKAPSARRNILPRSREARSSTISAPAPADRHSGQRQHRQPHSRRVACQSRATRARNTASAGPGSWRAIPAPPRRRAPVQGYPVRRPRQSGPAMRCPPGHRLPRRSAAAREACARSAGFSRDISPRRCVGAGLPVLRRSPGAGPWSPRSTTTLPPCRALESMR